MKKKTDRLLRPFENCIYTGDTRTYVKGKYRILPLLLSLLLLGLPLAGCATSSASVTEAAESVQTFGSAVAADSEAPAAAESAEAAESVPEPTEDAQSGNADAGPTETAQPEATDTIAPQTDLSETENTAAEADPSAGNETAGDPAAIAAAYLENMTLREKVLQRFMVAPEQLTDGTAVTECGEALQQAIQENPVGGIICFAQNLVDREQSIALLADLQASASTGLFLAVDEEGGLVSRVGSNAAMGATCFGPMGDVSSEDEAYNVGLTIGNDLKALGFNLDFAPVADVNSNPSNPVIGTRAFSDDPQETADLVAACVSGFRDSGILCTLKHFPGHGDTDTDSHYGEAKTMKTQSELESCELIPFAAGIAAGAELVMVGHITAPNITGETEPASLSHYFVTELLRNSMGFEGVIITDSMRMEAITDSYSAGEAALLAMEAGCDIVLMPDDLEAAVTAVVEAIENGSMSESDLDSSVLRILTLKAELGLLQ